MKDQDLSALVCRAPDNVLYLTNYWCMKGYDAVIFPRHGEPTLIALHAWLDCWHGIGAIVVGMDRQGYAVSLKKSRDGGWTATFNRDVMLSASTVDNTIASGSEPRSCFLLRSGREGDTLPPVRLLTIGEGEPGAQRDERAGEGAAHPGQHPRARDDVVSDRRREQPIADEDHEREEHEHGAELEHE